MEQAAHHSSLPERLSLEKRGNGLHIVIWLEVFAAENQLFPTERRFDVHGDRTTMQDHKSSVRSVKAGKFLVLFLTGSGGSTDCKQHN